MVVNMGFVDMGVDNKCVVALGETTGQFASQPVCFLRCDLTGNKGLPQMVGNHIILTTGPACLFDVLLLRKQELRIGNLAVAAMTGNESAMIGFLRILYIVDNVRNGLAHRPAFAAMQGHDPCSCHDVSLPSNEKGAAMTAAPDIYYIVTADLQIQQLCHFLHGIQYLMESKLSNVFVICHIVVPQLIQSRFLTDVCHNIFPVMDVRNRVPLLRRM